MFVLTSQSIGAAGETPPAPADLAGLLGFLLRRRRAALTVCVLFFALVAAVTLLTPKSYTTHVQLIAGSTGAPVAPDGQVALTNLPVLNALLTASGVQSPETYAQLFQETPVAQDVATRLNLHVSPEALLSRISVRPVTNTTILTLSATWSDPRTSARIANGFAAAIVERQRQLVSGQAQGAIAFLSRELPSAQNAVRIADARLARFESTHHIADINAQTQSLVTASAGIETQIGQARVDARQAQAQLASVQAQLAQTPPTIEGSTEVAQNPVIANLQQQIATVDVQLREALAKFTNRHPVVIDLKNQQAQLRKAIASAPATVVANRIQVPNPLYAQLETQAAQYAAAGQAAAAQVGALERQRASLAPQLERLPATTARFAELAREARSAQDVYTALQQKFNEATILKSTALSDVTITQPASADEVVVRPSVLRNLTLGSVLGVLLAIAVAWLLDAFDRTVKDERQVERELGTPVIVSVPFVNLQTPEPSWVRTLTIESFLRLASLLRRSPGEPVRSVCVTSPGRGDGKSTIALNAALALAEIEPRVLLVDAHFGYGTGASQGVVAGEIGLAEVLLGKSRLFDAVQTSKYASVDMLPAGTVAGNPLRLLREGRLDALLAEALQTYTSVVIDTASGANVFASLVARSADATLFVMSAGCSDVRLAKRALRALEQVGVAISGIVLNRIAPKREEYEPVYGDHPVLARASVPSLGA